MALSLTVFLVAKRGGSRAGESPGVIRIATKPMAEQFVLGEMLAQLIEAETGLKATIVKGIGGGTANIHPALVRGDFDLYPEYTGTAWSYVLKKEGIPPEDELYAELRREYAGRFGLEWVGLYGFNNTFGVALRGDIADKAGITAISGLAPLAGELVFGAEYDFYEREDGFDALCAAYGLTFKKHMDIDIGLKYAALDGGRIDVINVGTTDGRLGDSSARLLRDDKGFYRNYYCGTVVRADVLARHPGLRAALLRMENILDEEDMAGLNHEVEAKQRDEREVAREFLAAKGLIR